jgi:hypothetical protein
VSVNDIVTFITVVQKITLSLTDTLTDTSFDLEHGRAEGAGGGYGAGASLCGRGIVLDECIIEIWDRVDFSILQAFLDLADWIQDGARGQLH